MQKSLKVLAYYRLTFGKPRQDELIEAEIQHPEISSSNLQKAIDKALIMSSRLNETRTYGDLEQKQKLQRLVFPSGIGYDKQNNRVRTKRVNSIFSAIPLLTRDSGENKKRRTS